MGDVQGWSGTDASNTDLFPEGMAFSGVNDGGRAVQGAMARWFKDTNGSIDASGSANTFAITSNRTIAAYADDLTMAFTANHTIDGAATLNLNGIGAKDIKRFNGNALASGDIVSGQPVIVIYKLAADDWFMVSAAAALTGNSFSDFDENVAPGDPAANDARLYAKDVGGVTMLAYRDSAATETVLNVPARAYDDYDTNGDISTVIPFDNTTPLSSEGTEILSAAITLKIATSRVRARFQGWGAASGNDSRWAAAIFRSTTCLQAGAVGISDSDIGGNDELYSLPLDVEEAPGSVGPHTYSVRVGPANSTLRLNGDVSGRLFGGASKATLVVEEVFI